MTQRYYSQTNMHKHILSPPLASVFFVGVFAEMSSAFQFFFSNKTIKRGHCLVQKTHKICGLCALGLEPNPSLQSKNQSSASKRSSVADERLLGCSSSFNEKHRRSHRWFKRNFQETEGKTAQLNLQKTLNMTGRSEEKGKICRLHLRPKTSDVSSSQSFKQPD